MTDNDTRICSACKQEKPRSEMLTKRIQFITPGHGYKLVQSRTVAILCAECRKKDPTWKQKRYTEAAGY